MSIAVRVAIALAVMVVNVKAEDAPFVGSWEADSYGGSCEHPKYTILITPSHLGKAEIEKTDRDGDWYVLTTRESSGEQSKTALLIEGDTLIMQSVTEAQARTVRFYFKCK